MGTGSQIGRVRGLGSAKHGARHWIVHRTTAIGNIILLLWFLFSLTRLPGLDYQSVTGWIAQPLVAVPFALMLVNAFWHLRLGLQVLIEDYVHDEGLRFGAILLLNFYSIAAPALGLFAIARIAFTGTPH
jgi:succinate dehydrogenase / fumarate reductase membrane anchor subunit